MNRKTPVKGNYAFIDSQNLNLGVRSLGWKVDYKKLRLFLKNKYNIEQAFMFIGFVANNQKLYTSLQHAGFILIFKPTIRYFIDGVETFKGNVDAELVLHAAAIEYDNYNKAVIVTADGDFTCLVEFLSEKNKLLKIITPSDKYSQLLQPYKDYIDKIGQFKNSLKYQKSQTRRSVETLGLSGNNGDTNSIIQKNKINSKIKTRKSNRGKK
jgi:uncharacterized LabA/DUF88 family protein